MTLAKNGGSKSVKSGPRIFEWIDSKDLDEVIELISSQKLSGFLAQSGESYLGGLNVIDLEKDFCKKYNANHAVTFNSWTSGLEAIFIALDLEPASEVIVTPWTMSGTVAAIVLAGYVPVFSDIDPNSFNLDVNRLRAVITPRTRAICAVDIFGLPANWPELRNIADEFNLKLVADSAQSPSATVDGKPPFSFADAGGYSFNRHKHIQTGEGGIALTNSKVIADRMRAIRNHGEVSAQEITLSNRVLIGHNWRLGEFEALLARKQLQRFDHLITSRQKAALKLIEELRNLPGIYIPDTAQNYTHDYYILGMHMDSKVAGISRDFAVSALRAEGVDFVIGRYCELHRLPAYSEYRSEDLKTTNELNDEKFLGLYLCGYEFDDQLINETIEAFKKVWASHDSE